MDQSEGSSGVLKLKDLSKRLDEVEKPCRSRSPSTSRHSLRTSVESDSPRSRARYRRNSDTASDRLPPVSSRGCTVRRRTRNRQTRQRMNRCSGLCLNVPGDSLQNGRIPGRICFHNVPGSIKGWGPKASGKLEGLE